jgi:hypothetical protein
MTRRCSVDEVMRFLGEGAALLDELRSEGLFEEDSLAPDAAEELRVAVSLVRELGVNPAGVEVVLHMRRRMLSLERRMEHSLRLLLSEPEGR